MSKLRKKSSSKHQAAKATLKLSHPQSRAVPSHLQQRFIQLYESNHFSAAIALSYRLVDEYPKSVFSWKALGTSLLEGDNLQEAIAPLKKARELAPDDPEPHNTLAKLAHKLGQASEAVIHLEKALSINPRFLQARMMITKFLSDIGRYEESLKHIEIAEKDAPDNITLLTRKAHALMQTKRFSEGLKTYEYIHEKFPRDSATLSNLANAYRSIGRFDDAEAAFMRALQLNPTRDKAYSNYLLSMHYNPRHSAEDLFAAHAKWDHYFCPHKVERAIPEDTNPARRLRIGLVSAGFRVHPVGQMITSAIEQLPRHCFELLAYTMNDIEDTL